MPPVGFEPTISAGERPQTYALDRATTGTDPNSALLDPILTQFNMTQNATNISFLYFMC